MAGRLIEFDQRGFVFSPFVDVAVNGMAAMFVFLAVYVAVVPPRTGDPPPPLQLVTDRLPDAVWYAGYEAHLSASGGCSGYAFSVEPPAELEALRLFLRSEHGLGWISGTPQPSMPTGRLETLAVPLHVTVTDLSGQTAARDLTLQILPAAVGFDPEAQRLRWATALTRLPDAWAERPYEFAPAVQGGIEPYELRGTGLPSGLTAGASRIVGTAVRESVPDGVEFQDYIVQLTVTDQQSALLPTDVQPSPALMDAFSLRVYSVPRLKAVNALPAIARAGQPYLGAIVAQGGRGALTWQVVAGELPAYLRLDERVGVIAGNIPHDAADTGSPVLLRFTLKVDDEDPLTPAALVECEIKVVPAMLFRAPR